MNDKGGVNIKSRIERVNTKIVYAGNIVEVYTYEVGYLKGYTVDSERQPKNDLEVESDEDIRKRSLRRAKQKIRRSINANHMQYGEQFTSKFLTLTFGDHVTDLKVANYEFTKFMQRLNYLIFGSKKANIKYTVVWELTKSGRIHYHLIIYNIPFTKVDEIANTWGNGFVKINKISDVDNVGAYIGEYLGGAEEGQAKEEFYGQKSYFGSRGLFKPIEITDKKTVESVARALPIENLTYSYVHENEHLGLVSYKQYNLSDVKNKEINKAAKKVVINK